MDNQTERQGQLDPQKSHQPNFDKDQPGSSPGQRQPDPNAIPELDEPDVEGVGKESGNSTAATTRGEGQKPKG